jgi:hypothetical protein
MLLTIEVMYVAVQRSKDALVALSFFILLVLVFFATLIYFAERGSWDANLGGFVDADGDPSMFDSIPQTAWFALVTMSTVGYGDVVPRSFLGKLLTMPLLMFGLLLIALPSFVLGRNFAIVFDAMNNQALIAVCPLFLSLPKSSLSPHSVPTSSQTPCSILLSRSLSTIYPLLMASTCITLRTGSSSRPHFNLKLTCSQVQTTHPAPLSTENVQFPPINHIQIHQQPPSYQSHQTIRPLTLQYLGRMGSLYPAQAQVGSNLNLGCGMVLWTVPPIRKLQRILPISN